MARRRKDTIEDEALPTLEDIALELLPPGVWVTHRRDYAQIGEATTVEEGMTTLERIER